jgi:hypothetical protein
VGLERGPLSLVSTTEELLERKSSGFGLENPVFESAELRGLNPRRTIPTERPPLICEVSANFFGDRGCHVVNVTDPYGRILGFLDKLH